MRSFGRLLITGAVLATVAGLVGCATQPKPAPPVVSEQIPPETPPEFFPDGSAEQNLPYFDESLRQLAVSDEPIAGQIVVDSLVQAGFDANAMQVSFDRTKTDLVADSIYVSVLIGTDCLLGQVVIADRSYAAVVEPAVGPETNICLIGETRTIDW